MQPEVYIPPGSLVLVELDSSLYAPGIRQQINDYIKDKLHAQPCIVAAHDQPCIVAVHDQPTNVRVLVPVEAPK